MSKQIAFLLTGLSLTLSSMGCCCLSGLGYNKCQPCNNGCPTGGYQQVGMTQSMDQTAYAQGIGQTAYAPGINQTATMNGAMIGTPIMASPGFTQPGFTQTVLVPSNPLPSYY